MTPFSIVEPTTKTELADYYRIRYEVLRKPWNQPESSTKDETEATSVHILVKDENGKGIATGRMQFNSADEAQIRSMAVSTEFQGKGIGHSMIKFLEDAARKKNIKVIVLDARENAVQFYISNGYKIIEPSYLLFGEIKHFRMKKIIEY